MIYFFCTLYPQTPQSRKKRENARKPPEIVRFRGARSHDMLFCFAIWLQGWDFSLPAQRHSRRSSQILCSRRSLFSPLSRSLFSSPAAVALKAHSLLLWVVRAHPFLQIKRKKTPMRLFSCWLVAPKKILFKLEPISMRRGVLLIAFKKLFGTV